jgi:hypothetical protein
MSRPAALFAAVLLAACQGTIASSDDDDDTGGSTDAAVDPTGDAGGSDDAGPPVDTSVDLPLGAVRPVDIMPLDRLGMVASRLPQVGDPALKAILESSDTMWYDRYSIIPGYQDSYGDNINFPVGMRPNTIDPGLIAVAGGHDFIFEKVGLFHFPFGNPAGAKNDAFVVDFWHVPRQAGALLPVVWWKRQPTSWHRRIEWMFPRDTVLGEVLFKVADGGEWYPFEIRTRTRRVDGWSVNVFRPFRTAEELAVALEQKRQQQPSWATAADVTALIAHLRNAGTLQASRLAATHFEGTFPAMDGATDSLPGLADATILQQLLMETPFRSAKGFVWKQSGALKTYAATTDAAFSIVPRGYNAGFLSVDDETCGRCHRDAARPFRDFYPSIMLYGELWGEDESFSWHPFDNASFVDDAGSVVGFGPPDNRVFRQDFEDSGLFTPYDPGTHADATYRKIPAPWRDYVYN